MNGRLRNRYFIVLNPLIYMVISMLSLLVFLKYIKKVSNIFTGNVLHEKILSQFEVEALLFNEGQDDSNQNFKEY